MITRKQAQKRILKFAKKYEGKEIHIGKLSERDLYDFILTDTYLNVDAMLGYDADVNIILDRAIENAERHKKDDFVGYLKDYGTEIHFII